MFQPLQKVITIDNDIPVDFQFQITFGRELPPSYYTVSPMNGFRHFNIPGTLKGLEPFDIVISFMPLSLCKAQLEFTFQTSEFNFVPRHCLVFGSGALELPQSLPEKAVLEPIVSIHAERDWGAKSNISLELITNVEKVVNVQKLDIFEAELESNVLLAKKLELHRFVSIGRDQQVEEVEPQMRKSVQKALLPSKEFRIEVPSQAVHQEKPNYKTDGSRLLLILLKAVYKVINRNRADRRIKKLKESFQGLSPVEEIVEQVELDIVLAPRAPKQYCEAEFNLVVLQPLPNLIKARPIVIKEPTYAERMGYYDLPKPPFDKLCVRC